ncbi:hypothetical protein EVAR_35743_1 [Eumeta japonica]|uniref:Uncharacterized protein n=1 Tax=Eumeta variegata TaxID=151549 RepID=A0A4C1VFB2_EUMVA|nr:hypothetical protein EVAR_35743_1 [Eumeta japonica]
MSAVKAAGADDRPRRDRALRKGPGRCSICPVGARVRTRRRRHFKTFRSDTNRFYGRCADVPLPLPDLVSDDGYSDSHVDVLVPDFVSHTSSFKDSELV